MAQAVFDDHPIEHYLRETGEIAELMPGGTAELIRELSQDAHYSHATLYESLPPIIQRVLNVFRDLSQFSSLQSPSPSLEFSEKFKYIVISSPLLSSSISFSPPPIRPSTPCTPGHFEHSPRRASSPTTTPTPVTPTNAQSPLVTFTLAWVVPLALVQGYIVSSILLWLSCKITALGLFPTSSSPSNREEDSGTLTLESLNSLVAANNLWHSSVSDALGILEDQELNSTQPSSPTSHLPSLRVALSSSLQSTQSKCDNVRQLLSALTSPILLSQLSEMYAPPSPPSIYASLQPQYTQKRRSSPSHLIRQNDLKALLSQNAKGSTSVPSTPSAQVIEHLPVPDAADRGADVEEESFGVAALYLRRKLRNAGTLPFHQRSALSLGSIRVDPPSPHHSPPPSASSGSRFTTLKTLPSPRPNPPSLSSLRLTVHSALAAKRFTCAHLLALRFPQSEGVDPAAAVDSEDDESYWDDVRSVIALLASTLEDASARLNAALAEAARHSDDEQSFSATALAPPPPGRPRSMPPLPRPTQSYAPIPSHHSRFAAHIGGISTALDDAREHLQKSVAAVLGDDAPAALEAYERLRRELGLAFRECERGRGALLDIVRRGRSSGEAGGLEESADDDETVSAARLYDERRFTRSSESENTLINTDEQLGPDLKEEAAAAASSSSAPDAVGAATAVGDDGDDHDDDASSHLLLGATPEHLPPPGIEEVFEAFSSPQSFGRRERSKLPREERIRLAKEARRHLHRREDNDEDEDENGDAGSRGGGRVERWGPGGEVVQELKDVIWKVSEQRKKMDDDHDDQSATSWDIDWGVTTTSREGYI